jgi:multisubunit Na+/H+ antiporter MnhF subunit
MSTIDKIALIVTVTISFILVTIVLGPFITGRVLSDDKAQIIGNLISAFMAIIGMYVGAKLKAGGDK